MSDLKLKGATVVLSRRDDHNHTRSDQYHTVEIITKDGKKYTLRPCSCAEVMSLEEES